MSLLKNNQPFSLPAGLFYAGYHPSPGQLPETYPAKLKISDITARPAANPATVFAPGRKLNLLSFSLPLLDFRSASHPTS